LAYPPRCRVTANVATGLFVVLPRSQGGIVEEGFAPARTNTILRRYWRRF
jgi:hypothetical protein